MFIVFFISLFGMSDLHANSLSSDTPKADVRVSDNVCVGFGNSEDIRSNPKIEDKIIANNLQKNNLNCDVLTKKTSLNKIKVNAVFVDDNSKDVGVSIYAKNNNVNVNNNNDKVFMLLDIEKEANVKISKINSIKLVNDDGLLNDFLVLENKIKIISETRVLVYLELLNKNLKNTQPTVNQQIKKQIENQQINKSQQQVMDLSICQTNNEKLLKNKVKFTFFICHEFCEIFNTYSNFEVNKSKFQQKLIEFNSAQEIPQLTESDISYESQDGEEFNKNNGLGSQNLQKTTVDTFNKSNAEQTQYSLLFIILFAFLGGFILNFMPCVLPVLMLKLNSLAKSSRVSKVYTIIGVFFTFFCVALFIIISNKLGNAVGWGMHFQNIYFLAFMSVVLFFMFLNSLNIIDLTFSLKINIKKTSVFYDFFSGIIITLLAIPCTAPFLTVAVTYALTATAIETIVIFLTIAGGFSMFYLLPKSLLNKISENKIFSLIFQCLVNVLLLITMLWILFLLFNLITLTQMIMILLFFVIILICLLKHFNNNFLYISVIVMCIFLTVCMSKRDNKSFNDIQQNVQTLTVSHLNALKENNIVLVFVTADWCITCKTVQKLVINSHEVQEALKINNVKFLIGDITNENIQILEFIKNHNRSGIPFVGVFYKDRVKILSELPTKTEIIHAVEKVKEC